MTQYVLTLVGRHLSEDTVETAVAEIRLSGASADAPSWLAAGSACDVGFDGARPEAIETAVRRVLAGGAVDLAAQPEAGRRKRLLVADLESTVIAQEMLDELAELAGKREEVARVTARAMAGEIDFADSVRQRVATLAGVSAGALDRALKRVEIDPGAATLVATMAADGAFTALVSGGFTVFAGPIARRLGFHAHRANELLIEDGRLTGGVVEPILSPDTKVRAVEGFCRRLDVEAGDAVAVGDGANDLPMLLAVGLGVAYHAKPLVAGKARYSVRHGDLRTLLYYQGYRESDFATG
ncbi:MAG: phosphoserine phosphatase SerB [bacterium]|nr:phosphoserine phosphatase SerB [bacterium]